MLTHYVTESQGNQMTKNNILNIAMVVRFFKDGDTYFIDIKYSNTHNKQNRIVFNSGNFELNWYLAVKTFIRLGISPIYEGTSLIPEILENLKLKLYYLIETDGKYVLVDQVPVNNDFLFIFSENETTFDELTEKYKHINYNTTNLNWGPYTDVAGLPGVKECKATYI